MEDLWQCKIVANGSQKLVKPPSTLFIEFACVAYEQPKSAKADGRVVVEFWPEDDPSIYRRGSIASFSRDAGQQSKLNMTLDANRSYYFAAKGCLNVHMFGRYIAQPEEEDALPPPAGKGARVSRKQINATASSSKAQEHSTSREGVNELTEADAE